MQPTPYSYWLRARARFGNECIRSRRASAGSPGTPWEFSTNDTHMRLSTGSSPYPLATSPRPDPEGAFRGRPLPRGRLRRDERDLRRAWLRRRTLRARAVRRRSSCDPRGSAPVADVGRRASPRTRQAYAEHPPPPRLLAAQRHGHSNTFNVIARIHPEDLSPRWTSWRRQGHRGRGSPSAHRGRSPRTSRPTSEWDSPQARP
jgi:hypothetical protein